MDRADASVYVSSGERPWRSQPHGELLWATRPLVEFGGGWVVLPPDSAAVLIRYSAFRQMKKTGTPSSTMIRPGQV